MYSQLKEINWMPAVDQVLGALPSAFKEKFPTTYAIIDGSEVFIETPSDLHMQSSTWSQYKHHNTVKFLVACTPNATSSPVFVGLQTRKAAVNLKDRKLLRWVRLQEMDRLG